MEELKSMEDPYFSYLVMMFREMDIFSIPEVGTFIRVVRPAVRSENEIIAPKEEFVYDYKEEHKLESMQFLSEKLQITPKESKKMLEEISKYMFRYFDYVSKYLEIPGIGVMEHFPKNDTFGFKTFEDLRLNTFGFEDLEIKKETKKKSTWSSSWFRRLRKKKK